MKKADLDLYSDYLLSTFGAATATGLSAMVEGDVSHDQITRFLSAQEYTSKDLWQQVKSTVRSIERDDGVLIFDDTIEHEARNDSDQLRVVLIFDIWNPYLTAEERELVSVMMAAKNEFMAG